MSEGEEWGPWIEHDGKGCPCVGKMAHVVYNTSNEFVCIVLGTPEVWIAEIPFLHKVIRYRIRKPRAILDLIQMIADLPVPALEYAA